MNLKTAFLNTKTEREVWMIPLSNLKDYLREPIPDDTLSLDEKNACGRKLKLLCDGVCYFY